MYRQYYVFLWILSITGCAHIDSVNQNHVWDSTLYHASGKKIANKTERSGDLQSYEVCVTIPSSGFMIKESVKTQVIAGVPEGTGGTWRKDFDFEDNNAYGPTKVCRIFDHQLYDQDRLLEISVDYKMIN
jgi:hypothetical protein